MVKETDALQEFAEKYMVGTPYTLMYKDGNPYIVENNFLSDLTALISEHYYPKEFTLWFCSEDFYNEFNEYTDEEGLIFWEDTQSDLIITSTDELFNYWKEDRK